jgi:hypothetical protein
MNKEFCTYEQSLALKELGFDEPCFFAFDNCSTPMRCSDLRTNEQKFSGVNYNSSTYTSQPTYSQAFRWFREKHDHYSEIRVGCTQIDGSIGYEWWIWKPNGIEEWSLQIPGEEWSYETYEEAEQSCLDKLIEICKNK